MNNQKTFTIDGHGNKVVCNRYPKTLTEVELIKVDYIVKQLKKELKNNDSGLSESDMVSYWNNLFIKTTGREILTGDMFGWEEVFDFVAELKKI